jgi:hypothetical protein
MQLGKGGDPARSCWPCAARCTRWAATARPALPLRLPVPSRWRAGAPSRVAAGIAAATQLGQTADGKQILLATCTADSPLLLELGRLRD